MATPMPVGIGSPALRSLRPRPHALTNVENLDALSPRGSPFKPVTKDASPMRGLQLQTNSPSASPVVTLGKKTLGIQSPRTQVASPRTASHASVASPRAANRKHNRSAPLAVFQEPEAEQQPIEEDPVDIPFPCTVPAAARYRMQNGSFADHVYDPHATDYAILVASDAQAVAARLLSPVRCDSGRVKLNFFVDEHGFLHDSISSAPEGARPFLDGAASWSRRGIHTARGKAWIDSLIGDNSAAGPVSYERNQHLLASYKSKSDDSAQSAVMHTILQDIPRTFTSHVHFVDDDSEARQELFNILVSYSEVDPGVGYCQGMSYLAAVLLMHVPEADAFSALYRLLQSERHLKGFYDPELSQLQIKAEVFDHLLERTDAELFNHLTQHGLVSLMYVTQWFMRVFTCLPEWEMTLFALDLMMRDGYPAMVQLALSIVVMCREELLSLHSINQLLPFLHNVPRAIVNESSVRKVMETPVVSIDEVCAADAHVKRVSAERAEAMKDRRANLKRQATAQETPIAKRTRRSTDAPSTGYLERIVRQVATPFRSLLEFGSSTPVATPVRPAAASRTPLRTPSQSVARTPAAGVRVAASTRMTSPRTFSPTSAIAFEVFATPTPMRRRVTQSDVLPVLDIATPEAEKLELLPLAADSVATPSSP